MSPSLVLICHISVAGEMIVNKFVLLILRKNHSPAFHLISTGNSESLAQ